MIRQVLLFTSVSSPDSISCETYCRRNSIPVTIVRLDSVQARQAAANGKYFTIEWVPTLKIILADGTVDTRLGSDEIMVWLEGVKNRNTQNREPQGKPPEEEVYSEEPSFIPGDTTHDRLRFEPIATGPQGKPTATKPYHPQIIDTNDEVEPEIINSEDDKPKKKQTRKKAQAKAKHVPSKTNSSNGKWQDIQEQASKMRNDMHKTLGYDDDALP